MNGSLEFASWELMLLAGLVLVPSILWHHVTELRRPRGAVRFSEVRRLASRLPRPSFHHRHMLACMRLLAVALAVIALGRPRLTETTEEMLTRGIDIVVTLDLSGSMLAEDIDPNRITAAKRVVKQFIEGRKSDRIGLVVFAGRAYTQCPLTTDYVVLQSLLDRLDANLLREDGTAIGMGLAMAVNRLRETGAKSRVIILVTDGRNNAGKLEPSTSAELAKALGIKIYAIGVASKGRARVPIIDPRTRQAARDPFTGQPLYGYTDDDLNEDVLRGIATTTGGLYFRATATQALEAVFSEIDRLERSEIKTRELQRHTEYFIWFLGPAIGLLLLEALLANTRYRRIP